MRGDLTFIGIRHEGAAAFAASAYGKLTGQLAACFAIAGPGSTNLLTGLYDAKVDRAPVLAISGQVPSKVRGRGAFQDLDLTAAFADVAVSTQTVQRDSDHVELMNLACKHALVQRGVAHLVLPDEVQALPAAPDARAGWPERTACRISPFAPADGPIEQRSALIAGAKRPVIVVGHGARAGIDDVVRLAERLHAPIAHHVQGQGHRRRRPSARVRRPRSQRHAGRVVAHERVRPADRVRRVVREPHRHRVVQADHPGRLRSRRDRSLPRRSRSRCSATSASTARRLLADANAASVKTIDQRDDVAARKAIWHAEKERRALDDNGLGVASAPLFEALTRHTPENAVIAVDVGNNTYSFGRYFECKPANTC